MAMPPSGVISQRCDVDGPAQLKPAALDQLRLGMTRSEVEAVLGQPDYSPAAGQYYFATGGVCWFDEGQRQAPCGIVVDYVDRGAEGDSAPAPDRLRSCWWGPIGE